MATRSEFVERQMDEVKETFEALKRHRDAIEEELKTAPEGDELRDILEDVEEGIVALEPIMADFQNQAVDSEELIKYAQTIEDWQAREKEISEQLKG